MKLPPEKGTATVKEEIESTKQLYNRLISERQSKVEELDEQINEYKKKNKLLDAKITEMNFDVCEQQMKRNMEFEKRWDRSTKNKYVF